MRLFLLIMSLAVLSISPVHAEVFVWEDPETGATASYPDTWRRVVNQKPDTQLTILAPGRGDFAKCKLRIRDDGSFKVYPLRYSDEIQRLNFNKDFIREYLNVHNEPVIHKYSDNGGFGRGFAGWAEVSYTPEVGPVMRKRGLIFATLYRDKVYIADCAAHEDRFDIWARDFMSFIKSVDIREILHELPSGHYRPFLQDPHIVINGPRGVDKAIC